jgi:hypothetical protein
VTSVQVPSWQVLPGAQSAFEVQSLDLHLFPKHCSSGWQSASVRQLSPAGLVSLHPARTMKAKQQMITVQKLLLMTTLLSFY